MRVNHATLLLAVTAQVHCNVDHPAPTSTDSEAVVVAVEAVRRVWSSGESRVRDMWMCVCIGLEKNIGASSTISSDNIHGFIIYTQSPQLHGSLCTLLNTIFLMSLFHIWRAVFIYSGQTLI